MTTDLRLTPAREALLDELVREDELLNDANENLRMAQMRWAIASKRYQAVRDLARERLDENVYKIAPLHGYHFASEGRFRFMGMGPGEAVVAGLKEQTKPVSMPILLAILNQGGAGLVPRSVNAALMQTKGVEKTEEDEYVWIDPEDLPFDN